VAKTGDVLEIPALKMRIVFLQTTEDTGGELLEYDVIGHPQGFVAQRHVHPSQEERQEVIAGEAGLSMHGRKVIYGPGEVVTIPPGTPHRHFPGGPGESQVRFTLRPALQTEALLERLAELGESGQIAYRGFLKPLAAAQVMRDFAAEGHAAGVPVAAQHAFSSGIISLAAARERRAAGKPASEPAADGNAVKPGREYVFIDQWDVDAPIEDVFDALADGTTYPAWWRPTYIGVEADGPVGPGQVSRQHFKGKLPYHLHTTSTILDYERPTRVSADVVGDLSGRGIWTLTENDDRRVHVRFDWTVFADKPILRLLTPVLRPVFRWNHNWAITRAMEGLEPYARRRARARVAATN
jgi:quercetin dioxygenase-like cupin family protein/uncharacterized protein YndB with AHSA1/START domain